MADTNDKLEQLIEAEHEGIEPGFDDQTEDSVPPTPIRYRISSYGSDLEVELLIRRLNEGIYIVPDYQRGFVWTQTRASQFIESLLLGLPVPGIFLYRNPDRTFLVIDGHQRLKSLQGYYEKQFPGTDRLFTLKGVEARFVDRTFDSLEDEDLRALNSSVIHATVIEQEQPDESEKSSIYHIFRRINSGAVPLTPHEIRYCVSYGVLSRAIKEWNLFPSWRLMIGAVNPRMKDQELILRFFAITLSDQEYKPPMQSFLDGYLERHQSETVVNGIDCFELFARTCDFIMSNIGPNAFRLVTAVNAAFTEAVMYATASGLLDGNLKAGSEYVRGYESLKNDKDFLSAISRATAREDNVTMRLSRAKSALTG